MYQNILVTGGSGLLGKTLRGIMEYAHFPSSVDFNVKDYEQMYEYINELYPNQIDTIIHCAALTSSPNAKNNPHDAIDVNIIGTANIAKLCHLNNLRLIYISTDYVFDGTKGNYKEGDPMNPFNNYGMSKLGGECAVRMIPNSLSIRLSFGPNSFPFDKAYVDQYTSRIPVNHAAHIIIDLVKNHKDLTGIIHIGSDKRSVYDYAKNISPEKEITPIYRKDNDNIVPEDVSLNTSKYKQL